VDPRPFQDSKRRGRRLSRESLNSMFVFISIQIIKPTHTIDKLFYYACHSVARANRHTKLVRERARNTHKSNQQHNKLGLGAVVCRASASPPPLLLATTAAQGVPPFPPSSATSCAAFAGLQRPLPHRCCHVEHLQTGAFVAVGWIL
jgi:hypothetical protein